MTFTGLCDGDLILALFDPELVVRGGGALNRSGKCRRLGGSVSIHAVIAGVVGSWSFWPSPGEKQAIHYTSRTRQMFDHHKDIHHIITTCEDKDVRGKELEAGKEADCI